MSTDRMRPNISGTFGVVSSTHWIATSVSMGVLERGGNAFDAAVACGFVLQIVEPHLNGPGGDMVAVMHSAARGTTEVLCGQGTAPAKATIAHYQSEDLKLIPGNGLLATVVPGSFGGWMLILRDHGTLSVREVLEPAIYYARHGHPLLDSTANVISRLSAFFEIEWPTSYSRWVPSGSAPQGGALFRNEALAQTWERIVKEADKAKTRALGIEAARRAFYSGFVAEQIDKFCRTTSVLDASGERHRAVLSGEDMDCWRATTERAQIGSYRDWTIAKPDFWGQGPVLLQTLRLLQGFDIAEMDPLGPDFVHHVIEALKLTYSDREAYFGDPARSQIPTEHLLSETYATERRALIKDHAAAAFNPGQISGFECQREIALNLFAQMGEGTVYEPTMQHLSDARGDTVHLNVVDRWGNMIAATPSGGWLQSSPTIPEIGFCLNTRAQMFWLTEGLPTSLAPNRRPRTTLSPTLAFRDETPYLICGTPGGDQQDQWQLIFLLWVAHNKADIQEAVDAPLFHSTHTPSSFYPRTYTPRGVVMESRFETSTVAELRRRGHDVTVVGDWDVGRLTCASRDPSGLLRAAATSRKAQAYAVGR